MLKRLGAPLDHYTLKQLERTVYKKNKLIWQKILKKKAWLKQATCARNHEANVKNANSNFWCKKVKRLASSPACKCLPAHQGPLVTWPSAQLSTHYYSLWGPNWQRTQTSGTEVEQKLNTERPGEHCGALILQEEEQPPLLKWARVCCLTPHLSKQSIHTSPKGVLAFTPSQLSTETSGKAAASDRALRPDSLDKKHECSGAPSPYKHESVSIAQEP